MTVLLDKSPAELPVALAECGPHFTPGQLITPLTSYADWGGTWAMDNGAYSKFDLAGYRRLLIRQRPHRARCLFIAAPDVPFYARRTLELFEHWAIELRGWPRAIVCQNGQEELPIPWKMLDAVFIGGDDAFKLSKEAEAIIKAAKALGKWAHIGRVNTADRLKRIYEMGADSFDGSGISKHTHMRNRVANSMAEIAGTANQAELFNRKIPA